MKLKWTLQPRITTAGLRESRWADPGSPSACQQGRLLVGGGDGKDFSLPPAWAQNFCQKHLHPNHPPLPAHNLWGDSPASAATRPAGFLSPQCGPRGGLEQT